MKQDLEKFLSSYKVPAYSQQELQETIQTAKQGMRECSPEKMEKNRWKQMFLILRFHFPKLFLLQVLLSILLLFIIYQQLKNFLPTTWHDDTLLYVDQAPVLVIGGILFSMITGVELLRNRLVHAWEYEKVCSIRLEKIIAFKLCALSISAFLVLGGSCLLLSTHSTALQAFPLFVMAVLPYLCITACIVQFIDHLQSLQSILFLYSCLSMFFFGMLSINITAIITFLLRYTVFIFFVIISATIFIIYHKLLQPTES